MKGQTPGEEPRPKGAPGPRRTDEAVAKLRRFSQNLVACLEGRERLPEDVAAQIRKRFDFASSAARDARGDGIPLTAADEVGIALFGTSTAVLPYGGVTAEKGEFTRVCTAALGLLVKREQLFAAGFAPGLLVPVEQAIKFVDARFEEWSRSTWARKGEAWRPVDMRERVILDLLRQLGLREISDTVATMEAASNHLRRRGFLLTAEEVEAATTEALQLEGKHIDRAAVHTPRGLQMDPAAFADPLRLKAHRATAKLSLDKQVSDTDDAPVTIGAGVSTDRRVGLDSDDHDRAARDEVALAVVERVCAERERLPPRRRDDRSLVAVRKHLYALLTRRESADAVAAIEAVDAGRLCRALAKERSAVLADPRVRAFA